MLKRKIKKDLVKSFNELNNYQNDSYLETLRENVEVTIPTFDKVKYKRNCMLTFGLSFAVLLLITILSASFVVEENNWKWYEDYDQFILTDDEIDYMEEKCINYIEKPIYYVSIRKDIYISLFYGGDSDTNFYYIKLDTTENIVTVTIGETTYSYDSKGFYYVGCIEEGQNIEKIEFTISRDGSEYVYIYYL